MPYDSSRLGQGIVRYEGRSRHSPSCDALPVFTSITVVTLPRDM
jgi:hypothetical protein